MRGGMTGGTADSWAGCRPLDLVLAGLSHGVNALAAAAGAFVVAAWQVMAPGPLLQPQTVVVEPGTGVIAIGRQLAAAGVIRRDSWLAFGARLGGAGHRLQAGEYGFPAAISVAGILGLMRRGEVIQHALTVPEGLTVAEVAELLNRDPALSEPFGSLPPEGSLLPETYHFVRGDSRQSLVVRMQAAMAATLAEAWATRSPGLALGQPAEVVALASIIEKETALAAERSRVAGVFLNRLRHGMRLQSDPTVVYGLTGGAGGGTLGRALTRADWLAESPYNTYLHAGLPPGPIANPGRAALMAAVAPEAHEYLYFVADGSGGHAFAATLEEHNRNVARWQRLRQRGEGG